MNDTILIADDEAPIRRLLSRALAPCRTLEAADGSAALRLAADAKPDLIVLDLGMPRLDGWQVLSRLRENPLTRATPVILLTGSAGLPQKLQGLELGADDYVTKPFVISELVARVQQLMRRHRVALSTQPLTGLPGAPVIELEVQRRLKEKEPLALLYLDIDEFKAYNDAYGFVKGDEVLRTTAQLLTRTLEAVERSALAGHIGGDDFVAVTALDDAPLAALRLARGFDAKAPSFYGPEHRGERGLWAPDRQGRLGFHPIMTASIGVATNHRRRIACYAEMVAVACEMKSYLKRQRRGFSRFAFDRRAG